MAIARRPAAPILPPTALHDPPPRHRHRPSAVLETPTFGPARPASPALLMSSDGSRCGDDRSPQSPTSPNSSLGGDWRPVAENPLGSAEASEDIVNQSSSDTINQPSSEDIINLPRTPHLSIAHTQRAGTVPTVASADAAGGCSDFDYLREAATSTGGVKAARRTYQAGEPVEIFSNSYNRWCKGMLMQIEGSGEGRLAICSYSPDAGIEMTKTIGVNHRHIRFQDASLLETFRSGAHASAVHEDAELRELPAEACRINAEVAEEDAILKELQAETKIITQEFQEREKQEQMKETKVHESPELKLHSLTVRQMELITLQEQLLAAKQAETEAELELERAQLKAASSTNVKDLCLLELEEKFAASQVAKWQQKLKDIEAKKALEILQSLTSSTKEKPTTSTMSTSLQPPLLMKQEPPLLMRRSRSVSPQHSWRHSVHVRSSLPSGRSILRQQEDGVGSVLDSVNSARCCIVSQQANACTVGSTADTMRGGLQSARNTRIINGASPLSRSRYAHREAMISSTAGSTAASPLWPSQPKVEKAKKKEEQNTKEEQQKSKEEEEKAVTIRELAQREQAMLRLFQSGASTSVGRTPRSSLENGILNLTSSIIELQEAVAGNVSAPAARSKSPPVARPMGSSNASYAADTSHSSTSTTNLFSSGCPSLRATIPFQARRSLPMAQEVGRAVQPSAGVSSHSFHGQYSALELPTRPASYRSNLRQTIPPGWAI